MSSVGTSPGKAKDASTGSPPTSKSRRSPLPLLVTAASGVALSLLVLLLRRGRGDGSGRRKSSRRRARTVINVIKQGQGQADDEAVTPAKEKGDTKQKTAGKDAPQGPFSKLKPTSRCVPLADGSACVVRREIPADNSCLFNAVGYCMHRSKTRASFLRSVVAREVSSHPEDYTAVFLGMPNAEYCRWIENRANWGGAIEMSILVKHYHREIAAWNMETAKCHTFGEESGYPKQVMLIYTGTHYDSLAIAAGPKASESDDVTEFNPRTKRGKLIVAAAKKLVELTHKGSQFYSSTKLKCSACDVVCKNQVEASRHAERTGHVNFEQTK